MATSAVFASAAKVEAAFVAYADGNVIESEKECRRAIEHAQDLMSWLARIQSDGHAQIAWFDRQKVDPQVDERVRQVKDRDVADLLLLPRELSEPTARAVQKDGHSALHRAGMDDISGIQRLARDLLVSLEVGLPAIRQGELFEALSFRLEPTYLERTFSKLVSALIGLNLKANYAAAVSRVAAQRSLTQPVPTK